MEVGYKFECLQGQDGNFPKGLPRCGFMWYVLLIWCVMLLM